MNKHIITGLKGTLECDLEILSDLSKLMRSKGFESIEDFFRYLLDENIKSELKDLSSDEINEMITYLIDGITDNESWESGDNYFNCERPFTFMNAYKALKDCDSEFPYSDWDQISRHGRIALGKAFKQRILDDAKQKKVGEFYIELKDKTISNSALYQLYKKAPSLFD